MTITSLRLSTRIISKYSTWSRNVLHHNVLHHWRLTTLKSRIQQGTIYNHFLQASSADIYDMHTHIYIYIYMYTRRRGSGLYMRQYCCADDAIGNRKQNVISLSLRTRTAKCFDPSSTHVVRCRMVHGATIIRSQLSLLSRRHGELCFAVKKNICGCSLVNTREDKRDPAPMLCCTTTIVLISLLYYCSSAQEREDIRIRDHGQIDHWFVVCEQHRVLVQQHHTTTTALPLHHATVDSRCNSCVQTLVLWFWTLESNSSRNAQNQENRDAVLLLLLLLQQELCSRRSVWAEAADIQLSRHGTAIVQPRHTTSRTEPRPRFRSFAEIQNRASGYYKIYLVPRYTVSKYTYISASREDALFAVVNHVVRSRFNRDKIAICTTRYIQQQS